MSKKKEEKKTPERAFSYYPNYYSSVAITMYFIAETSNILLLSQE